MTDPDLASLSRLDLRISMLRLLREGFQPRDPVETAACILHDYWRSKGWKPALPLPESASSAEIEQEGRELRGWASPEGWSAVWRHLMPDRPEAPVMKFVTIVQQLSTGAVQRNAYVQQVSAALRWVPFAVPLVPDQHKAGTRFHWDVEGIDGWWYNQVAYLPVGTVELYRDTGQPVPLSVKKGAWEMGLRSDLFFLQSRITGAWFTLRYGVIRWCLPETLEELQKATRGDPGWCFHPGPR